MPDSVKVRFTRTYEVKDDERQVYEEGKTYTISDASAQHFVRRRVAVIDDGKRKPKGAADEPDAGDAAAG